jgi:hypothetical protein
MKCLKMPGLAAVAAMALVAFIGASSASATVLCKEAGTTTNCSANGKDYPAGSVIQTSLDSGTDTTFTTTGGSVENTCTGSTIEAVTGNTGGATETVRSAVALNKLIFSNCTNTTDVLEGGELEFHWISGTDNGTLTAKEFAITMLLGGLSCTYTAGTGTDLGTVTGGNPATIDISAVLNKKSGPIPCPSTIIWGAKYTVTSPTPLYVSER